MYCKFKLQKLIMRKEHACETVTEQRYEYTFQGHGAVCEIH